MGRKILLITTDMMRWDSLGFTGDEYARTPNLDDLPARACGSRRLGIRIRCVCRVGCR